MKPTDRPKWCCPECGSTDVHICLPSWHTETTGGDLTFINVDEEAEVRMWCCCSCGESGPGEPDRAPIPSPLGRGTLTIPDVDFDLLEAQRLALVAAVWELDEDKASPLDGLVNLLDTWSDKLHAKEGGTP